MKFIYTVVLNEDGVMIGTLVPNPSVAPIYGEYLTYNANMDTESEFEWTADNFPPFWSLALNDPWSPTSAIIEVDAPMADAPSFTLLYISKDGEYKAFYLNNGVEYLQTPATPIPITCEFIPVIPKPKKPPRIPQNGGVAATPISGAPAPIRRPPEPRQILTGYKVCKDSNGVEVSREPVYRYTKPRVYKNV